jgi:primosomal protein N' (replication factor Y) (superfamily II helicase)
VVLGARSAVFAPFPDLGLIILDEEHDGSYKQTEKPRYHARSVALMRARDCGAVVMLGSATPALESLENCRRGKYKLLRLPDRVGGGTPPAIEIVDMSEAEDDLLSSTLLQNLERCHSQGEKAILLLNRRGHSRLRLCRSCGDVARCSRCDIPLTYHTRQGQHPQRSLYSGGELMLCHYCGQEKTLQSRCPACSSQRWVLVGAGTQQLEMELGLACPGMEIFRMDADSTRRRGAHSKILSDFDKAGPAILIGTQMIAKGHHFPAVTLVGVISADTGLFQPDFRAAEKSWQLLTQVAGRAGRGSRPGRVVIQTFNPTHPVLVAVADGGNPEDLIQEELNDRRQLGYPPFRPLLSLVVGGPDEAVAARAAEKLVDGFRKHWPEHPAEILGPVPAFIPRIKDRFRQQILVKGRLGRDTKLWFADYFQEIVKSMRRSGSLSLDLDVDPQSIL